MAPRKPPPATDTALIGERVAKLEVHVANTREALDFLREDAKDSARTRKEMYGKLDDIVQHVTVMQSEQAAQAAKIDTIITAHREVENARNQMLGAGKLGRALWRVGGWLLAAAVSLYSFWSWLVGKPPP